MPDYLTNYHYLCIMKRIVLSFILLLGLCSTASADNIVKKGLKMMDEMAEIKDRNIDSNYIAIPKGKWTLGLKVEAFGNPATVREITDWRATRYSMKSDVMGQVGILVGYKGLQFNLNIDRLYFQGKFGNKDMTLTFYKHRYGLDLSFMDQKDLSCSMENGIGKFSSDQMRQYSLTLNGYYVFNHRKFSMPAVHLQTFTQLRSAGSWMLSGQAYWSLMRTDWSGNQERRMDMVHFAIGGGYGYNWVPNKHWLLHVSAMPHILPFYYYYLTEGGRVDYTFPPIYLVGRVHLLYHWKSQYLGLIGSVQTTHLGSADKCDITNTFWRAKLFYSIRF